MERHRALRRLRRRHLLPWVYRLASGTASFAGGAYIEIRFVVSGGDPERVGSALVLAGPFPHARRSAGNRTTIYGRRRYSRRGTGGADQRCIWTRRFGGAADVIQRTIRVDGIERAILGVMPAGFRYPEFAQVWLPLSPPHANSNATTGPLASSHGCATE